MRRLVWVVFAGVVASILAAGLYAASPIAAAWTVREAIRTGDTDTLSRKIAWDTVRSSLKQSLKADAEISAASVAEASGLAKPTLWQRIKIRMGNGMVDRAVDATFTPDGLVRLYALRTKGGASPTARSEDEQPVLERLARFLSRIEGIAHPAFGQFVVRVADQDAPGRIYVGELELHGLEWRLVRLMTERRPVRTEPAPLPLVTSVR